MDAETLARAILTPDAPTVIDDLAGRWRSMLDRYRTMYAGPPMQIIGDAIHRNLSSYHLTIDPIALNDAAMRLARTLADGRRRHGLVKHLRDERRHLERMYR